MAGQQGVIVMPEQLEMATIQPLASSGSLFAEGFSTPWHQQQSGAVPWATVQHLLGMARDALTAKQQAAEVCAARGNRPVVEGTTLRSSAWLRHHARSQVLLRQVDQMKESAEGGTLLRRVRQCWWAAGLLLHSSHEPLIPQPTRSICALTGSNL